MIVPKKIFDQYDEIANIQEYKPFGGGHINDTFLTINKKGEHYILQRVNKNVFITDAIVKNYDVILNRVYNYQKENKVKITPDILRAKNGAFHIVDNEGYAWRLAEFIPGTSAYAISPDTEISFQAAKAMGKFQLFLNTLPFDAFDFTIINFHDPARRLKTFKNSLAKADTVLSEKAVMEIDFALTNEKIVDEFTKIEKELPKRITHNDTKLDNILFYDGGKTLVIDLDTVMPSTVLFDYGDMVRTFTSPAPEDEKDIAKVGFREEHFEALTRGYLKGLNGDLHQKEKNNLLLGAKAIIYEQILRFLTDYLLGNPYYKVKYPEHNLVRTKTQVKLLKHLLENEGRLEKLINNL